MTNPSDPPEPPKAVLDELLVAFGQPDAKPGDDIDFDDPAIDELLGLTPPADESLPADPLDSIDVEPVVPTEPVEPVVLREPAAPSRIIVIADDDQPDAVYLDEDAEERLRTVHADTSGSTTIVIGDVDDGVEAQYPASASDKAAMEPRMRARRIAVRRAAGRRRLKITVVVAVVLLLLVAGFGVMASSAFRVKTIATEGVQYANPDQLKSIIDDVRGTPMLLVDERAIRQQLESIAWVESARVFTDFPSTVVFDIRERQPLAFYIGGDGAIRVIDRESRVLDVITGMPIDYAHITSVGPDVGAGQFAGGPYADAAQYVVALPAEIRARLTSMSVDPATGDITMVLDERVTVRLGDGSDKQAKLVRLLQRVRDGLDGIVGIDVTTESPSVTPG